MRRLLSSIVWWNFNREEAMWYGYSYIIFFHRFEFRLYTHRI